MLLSNAFSLQNTPGCLDSMVKNGIVPFGVPDQISAQSVRSIGSTVDYRVILIIHLFQISRDNWPTEKVSGSLFFMSGTELVPQQQT